MHRIGNIVVRREGEDIANLHPTIAVVTWSATHYSIEALSPAIDLEYLGNRWGKVTVEGRTAKWSHNLRCPEPQANSIARFILVVLELSRGDLLTRKHTAFRSMADMAGRHGYRPSICCAKNTAEKMELADLYDEHMESVGDDRRAHRCCFFDNTPKTLFTLEETSYFIDPKSNERLAE